MVIGALLECWPLESVRISCISFNSSCFCSYRAIYDLRSPQSFRMRGWLGGMLQVECAGKPTSVEAAAYAGRNSNLKARIGKVLPQLDIAGRSPLKTEVIFDFINACLHSEWEAYL